MSRFVLRAASSRSLSKYPAPFSEPVWLVDLFRAVLLGLSSADLGLAAFHVQAALLGLSSADLGLAVFHVQAALLGLSSAALELSVFQTAPFPAFLELLLVLLGLLSASGAFRADPFQAFLGLLSHFGAFRAADFQAFLGLLSL